MHKLRTDTPGQTMLLLGNEAIARGAIEAGIGFAATYPGTPSSEISLQLFEISQESDLYFEYSTNEKVAVEVASAAANSGVNSMAIMKHVGVNVAADALMTLAYTGVRAGMLIVSADDPFMFSSQNEQDNRYYAKFSGIPMVEPSTIQEGKDMVAYALDVSNQVGLPVLFRTTTRLNHSTGAVNLGPIQPAKTKGDFKKDPFNFVPVPAVARKLHGKLLERMENAQRLSESSIYNTISGHGKWGIVCNGVSYNYVRDAVKDLNIEDRVKILRIGFSHPLPVNMMKTFIDECEKILVVEEGEPYMEEALKVFAHEEKSMIDIKGKSPELFSRMYEYDPALVRKTIAAYFDVSYTPPQIVDVSNLPNIPQRPPNLCPGCSHRATYYEVKKAAEELGLDTIYPTDIGCYTLGFLPPLSMGDYLICMGASVSTSGGFSKVNEKKKVVSFIGDSTFFHSGITGLINAVFNNHNFTLVILDNFVTAMTGHQPHPGVDMSHFNLEGYGRVSIEEVVKAIGVPHIAIVKPYRVKKSIEEIKRALEFKGVSVIISQEMCTLFAKSLKKHRGKPFMISDKCVNHRACVNELGCPAFFIRENGVYIDPVMCAGCSVCAQICPENAIRVAKD